MIEINGWVTIRKSFDVNGEDENKLISFLNQLKNKITEIRSTNEMYELNSLNGTHQLSISIAHNHRNNEIFDFYKWVAKNAIGSFGLLYVQDDEDQRDKNSGTFKVWRMKKGIVDELDDPFLSPVNPMIEE